MSQTLSSLPLEIIDQIILILGTSDRDLAYTLAAQFGRSHARQSLFPPRKLRSIVDACALGLVDLLRHSRYIALPHTSPHPETVQAAQAAAAKNGHVPVLEWWRSESDVSLSQLALDHIYLHLASENGHPDVLEWWKTSGMPLMFVYDESTLEAATKNGHVDVLRWWEASGLNIRKSRLGMELASQIGNIEMLEWSTLMKHPKTHKHVMQTASGSGYIHVLEWWKGSGLQYSLDGTEMDRASKYGHVNVLEWWRTSGLPLGYTQNALKYASEYGRADVLEWWRSSGLPLKVAPIAIDLASKNGHVNVLDWWKSSGLGLIYNKNVVRDASRSGRMDVLEWWRNSGLDINQ
ncbi:hypothetical protein BJ742DRAFT_578796 [Cladochytrium replicatum]|nr:hypothetical protein BJ742DRAFT_578796 [Cladochytrium replicatum]